MSTPTLARVKDLSHRESNGRGPRTPAVRVSVGSGSELPHLAPSAADGKERRGHGDAGQDDQKLN